MTFCRNNYCNTSIDKNMNKIDLIKQAGISSSTLNKLSKANNANISSLVKHCEAIDVKLEDIVGTWHTK